MPTAQVTVAPAAVQPALEPAATNVRSFGGVFGRLSTTWTEVAFEGPVLRTTKV